MDRYDAIVVGARCAGASTAMLLARKGYRVLVVDKCTFPSDTLSTHVVHPPGVAALRRLGVLDRVLGSGCPPIREYAFDFGPIVLTGAPGTDDEPYTYAPRRTILDAALVEGAACAGAEIREGFVVEGLVFEQGSVTGIRGRDASGGNVVATARVVVGADGRNSLVARSVDAPAYWEQPKLQIAFYTYWRGLAMDGRFEIYIRGGGGFAAVPTNDDLTLVVVGRPYRELAEYRRDLPTNYAKIFEQAPAFADRIRTAERVDRFRGTAVANWFRRPFGPGWALVGDAGYNKDYITAMGITDALTHAELLVDALDDAFAGGRSYEDAMAAYQRRRDEHCKPIYDFTCQLATLEPPPPQMQELFAAMQGDREAMDGFVRVNAGVMSPAEFFAPANLERIFARAAQR